MTYPNLPLVSVLIPLYNAEKWIDSTIESVENQSYSNIEIIVVDDFSTDDSFTRVTELKEKYANISLFHNLKKGACAARNYALRQSHGDYIMFLDADDLISKDKIKNQLCVLIESNDEMVLTFTSLSSLHNNELSYPSRRFIDRDYKEPCDLLIDMWQTGEFNCPHCYLGSKRLFEKSGEWNESTVKNQDGEYFAKVIVNASQVIYVPGEYAVWRIVENSVSHTYSSQSVKSQLDTYITISELILSRKNTREARRACVRNLGWWFFCGYPTNRPYLSDGYKLLQKWEEKLEIPYKGRFFRILRPLLGWKVATMIIKNRFLGNLIVKK